MDTLATKGRGENEGKPPFLLQYRHNGSDWCLTIWAESWKDAEARLRSIGYNGQIIGSDTETYSANAATMPLVHVWTVFTCWWRNLWRHP